MMPFETYPMGGRELLGSGSGGNCRHEYGLKLQRLTGQTGCAYCGLSLVDTYEHWLMLSVDHVVPTVTGTLLGIPREWINDFCNTVLCCAACNGFGNRYELPAGSVMPTSLGQFCELRDATFSSRRPLILACHEKERAFFDSKPWETAR